ncbi:MAG: vitamin B12 dependent-methionine synthase activation domain-containing protein [Clostridium sp.]
MEVNRHEVYRYLGCGNREPDVQTKKMTEECLSELEQVSRPRFFSGTFLLHLMPENIVDFSCFQVQSRSLTANLAGCEQVILFAATLGAGADFLLERYSHLEMSRAVVLQAAAAAMIESYCEVENKRLKEEFLKQGSFLRPRFSPGYGDFPLSAQKDLIMAIEAEKHVGITLTDSFLMIPSKSVTAVIGVGRKKDSTAETYDADGCKTCDSKTCSYRRRPGDECRK